MAPSIIAAAKSAQGSLALPVMELNVAQRQRGAANGRPTGSESERPNYQLPVLGQAPSPVVVQVRTVLPFDDFLITNALSDFEYAVTM